MPQTIQLLVTCIIDTLYPEIGEAVVRILERTGTNVNFPDGQTCCGQPAFNAGMRQQARQMAMHTIQVFEQTEGPVVIPSGSCCAMIRHYYFELFADDPEWLPLARRLAGRTYEFTEFLVDRLGVTDLKARFPGKLTYHRSCHLLRDLHVERQPLILLAGVKDAELVELPYAEECCGFGGVFSVEHSEISSAMLARKLMNLEASGAHQLVACDAGCLTHINGGLNRLGRPPCGRHIAEILGQE